MKKLIYSALLLCTVSCSMENNLEDKLYDAVESGANIAIDSLENSVDKELQRHTGIDSVASKIRSVDTINVEREVKREIIKRLSE
jgi:hypothetical protein